MSRTRLSRAGFGALELSGVMAVIAVVVAVLVVAGERMLIRSRELSCRSNLKQIGTALSLYAQDYGNRLPADPNALPYLAKIYAKNQGMFVCPADRSPAKVPVPPGPRGAAPGESEGEGPPGVTPPDTMGTSYFIVPGYANDDPPASVVAGDTRPRHAGRWNAVCLDGRAISLPASELAQYLPPGGGKR